MSNVFDAKDEPRDSARKQRALNERRADDAFLQNALKSRAGRNYFWRVLERCHLFEMTYVMGVFDATAFREGERSIGNQMLADIVRVAPEAFIEMMADRNKKPVEPEKEEDENG